MTGQGGTWTSGPPPHGPEIDWERWERGRMARKQVCITPPTDLVIWAKARLNRSMWVESALRRAQEESPATSLADLRARAEEARARLAAIEARIAEYEGVRSTPLGSPKKAPGTRPEEP